MNTRFPVTYLITLRPGETIDHKVEGICLEQSVELPASVISADIRDRIVGKIENISEVGGSNQSTFKVVIDWPVENIGNEITQFLNVLMGNISLNSGIQVVDVDWSKLPAGLFRGSAHGISGVREKLNIPRRAISCTALKPMGFSATELANLCSEFAEGGIDIIKDDHGLANQSYAPFEERLKRCTDAVRSASEKTGNTSWYVPHITASGDEVRRRYELAKAHGAGAVMVCPQLCSPAVMQEISSESDSLPIMAHPAFSGVFVQDVNHGFSKGFLYGALWRAMGADFIIYPNHSGRFSFTQEECDNINENARQRNSLFKQAWPSPGGGMQRETLPKWIQRYGRNTVFLIGGSLYKHPSGIKKAAMEIRNLLESAKYEE